MGQTDNSYLALNFQMFSQIFCLRGSIFSVFALEQFIFVLHYVFSDTSSTQLEQDTQGKITKYTLGVLFTSCESCFEDSSTIFTFPCVTVVTPHLLSTIWPFRPHKPYIFWKLMASTIQWPQPLNPPTSPILCFSFVSCIGPYELQTSASYQNIIKIP